MTKKQILSELNELIHDSPVKYPLEAMQGLKDAVKYIEEQPESEAYAECKKRIENMEKIIEDQQERIDIMAADMPIHCKHCRNRLDDSDFCKEWCQPIPDLEKGFCFRAKPKGEET